MSNAWRGPRTASSRITGTRAWQKLAKQVLREADYVCEIQTPRVCTGHATVVDKIIPAAQRPDLAWERTNLRASCTACNDLKARTTDQPDKRRQPGRRTPPTHPADALYDVAPATAAEVQRDLRPGGCSIGTAPPPHGKARSALHTPRRCV